MPASHLHHNMTAECRFFLPMTTSCPLSSARPPASWDSDRFGHAFAATTLVFLGDSLADQQWRSLLCLEAQHLDHKSVSKLLDGDASTSIKTKLYCTFLELRPAAPPLAKGGGHERGGPSAAPLPLGGIFARGEGPRAPLMQALSRKFGQSWRQKERAHRVPKQPPSSAREKTA